MTLEERARRRLIFALDVGSLAEASALVRTLDGEVGMFKIGKQLFMAAGPRAVTAVRKRGADVFLDLKFHDIPETVARAAVEATRLGVAMLNVHASGGERMMRETVTRVSRACRDENLARPILLAVTVLTSLGPDDLRAVGVRRPVREQVLELAKLADASGMSGVVASAQETAAIRSSCRPRFSIVTPGIRRREDELGDQNRVMTPAEAVAAGSDYIVVGRPIRDAVDPRAEARRIVDEIAESLRAARVARRR